MTFEFFTYEDFRESKKSKNNLKEKNINIKVREYFI